MDNITVIRKYKAADGSEWPTNHEAKRRNCQMENLNILEGAFPGQGKRMTENPEMVIDALRVFLPIRARKVKV